MPSLPITRRAARSRWVASALLCVLSFLAPTLVLAHLGNPYVIFEGRAGSFPVRVVVRQPDVVPGLAEISVRVLEGTPTRVTALPLHWRLDRQGAPRPDIAERVPGETNLFNAHLWLMTRGAYGVEVSVEGERGGSVVVPVNSVASARKSMPVWLGWALGILGSLLSLGAISIAAAAARESTLDPQPDGIIPLDRRRWGWAGAALGVVLVLVAVFGWRFWWRVEEEFHSLQVVFKPFEHRVFTSRDATALSIHLEFTDARRTNRSYALIPDHGKLLHLFLVGEGPNPAFAHLHPVRDSANEHHATLPPLPAGNYRVYTDLTHELGLVETGTHTISLEAPIGVNFSPADADDSWRASQAFETKVSNLSEEMRMELSWEGRLAPGEPTMLRASVKSVAGAPVALEPYLRMLGHAVVMREDGKIFAHVHPAGTLSMAAARNFAARTGGETAARASDVVCGDLSAISETEARSLGEPGVVGFPFVFPEPGSYLVWVQVRVRGKIVTGAFKRTVDGIR